MSQSEMSKDFNVSELKYHRWAGRDMVNAFLNGLSGLLALFACVPLISLLALIVYRGGKSLALNSFVELPPAPLQEGGGFGNAIIGTIVIVSIAAVLSVPVGIMTAIFVAYLGPRSKLAESVRFVARVLSGLPSILAGVFAYGAVVLVMKSYSAWAGGVALAVIMLPIVLLTAEQSLRMVPSRLIEAAIGMGCTHTQVVRRVLLPTASPGILTGVLLAVARAAGETAPLIFTALFSNYWLLQDQRLRLTEPTASMAVFIFNYSGSAYDNLVEMSWGAALVLVCLILVINLSAQFLSSRGRNRH